MSDVASTAPDSGDDHSRGGLHEQTVARLNNRDAQTAAGFEAHPYSYARSHSAAELLAAHPGSEDAPL